MNNLYVIFLICTLWCLVDIKGLLNWNWKQKKMDTKKWFKKTWQKLQVDRHVLVNKQAMVSLRGMAEHRFSNVFFYVNVNVNIIYSLK